MCLRHPVAACHIRHRTRPDMPPSPHLLTAHPPCHALPCFDAPFLSFFSLSQIFRVLNWGRAMLGSWGQTALVQNVKSPWDTHRRISVKTLFSVRYLMSFRTNWISSWFWRDFSGISRVEDMEEGETETWALRDLEGRTVLTLIFNLVVRPAWAPYSFCKWAHDDASAAPVIFWPYHLTWAVYSQLLYVFV